METGTVLCSYSWDWVEFAINFGAKWPREGWPRAALNEIGRGLRNSYSAWFPLCFASC